MLSRTQLIVSSTALLLAATLPTVAAQHGHGGGGMDMSAMSAEEKPYDPMAWDPDDPWTRGHGMPSYFRHGQYTSWHSAHAILMFIAWVVAMPLAIMLSTARSRWHLPAQVLFHILNGLGVFSGFVYNHATPDLYQGNAHHPLGWVVTGFTIVWTLVSFYVAYGEYKSGRQPSSLFRRHAATQNNAAYEQLQQYNDELSPTRLSRDSGQGTERNSASLFGNSRQNSQDSIYHKQQQQPPKPEDDGDFEHEKEGEPENRGFLGNNRVDRFLSKNVLRFSSKRVSQVVRFLQIFLEKVLLLLGFAALMTGFVVYGGVFREKQVFSGLAHYIKGGIFVFYGFLTLGRWMGAFTEFGWGWNLRPEHPAVAKWKTKIPSAEFVESFVIWLYGASNVFLEHLSDPTGGFTPQDVEHISITLLFFGGGLLGMMVESPWARHLMNTSVEVQKSQDAELAEPSVSHFASATSPLATGEGRWEQPRSYRIPMNPMPALTIMLLGMMMSSHHQESMVSTMLHAQWGGLFTAFALARGVTYVTMYLKPPTTHFASRPPSEIVAAFCLTAGGLIFMNSATDSVWAIETNGLDAMTIFTIGMGLTGVLLAWEVIVFAVKGWAVRKERAAAGKPLA